MGDNRLTRITTRTGDSGETGLADGTRLPKTRTRVMAMGEVDELNSAVGFLCVVESLDETVCARLRDIQHDLFDLGGELSLPGSTFFNRDALARLDTDIAQWNASLPPLTEFVLPGSDEANARAHLARTICRRAERTLWQLVEEDAERVSADLPRYLNRLSDALFVLARVLARADGGTEVVWRR